MIVAVWTHLVIWIVVACLKKTKKLEERKYSSADAGVGKCGGRYWFLVGDKRALQVLYEKDDLPSTGSPHFGSCLG